MLEFFWNMCAAIGAGFVVFALLMVLTGLAFILWDYFSGPGPD